MNEDGRSQRAFPRPQQKAGEKCGLALVGPRPAWFPLVAGAAIGVFWVAASIGTNYLFERASLALFLINAGYHAGRFTLMGVAFAVTQ